MINSRIEKYIQPAYRFLSNNSENGSYVNTFKGYIASFGPTVLQAGLKQAVAFYLSSESEKEGKKKVLDGIRYCVESENTKNDLQDISKEELFKYFLSRCSSKEDEKLFKEEVLSAVTALKLSLRAFKINSDS